MSILEALKALGPSIIRTASPMLVGLVVTALASAGLDWNLWRSLSVLGQIYGHTALYRDVASEIGDPGLQLALGARWALSPQWSADLAFQEDLIVNASPDFSLHLGIRFRPR